MIAHTALWRPHVTVRGGGLRSMRRGVAVVAGIQIDRRRYFEHSLKRQLELEARETEASLSCPLECVREVYNYSEFEKVLQESEKANDLVFISQRMNSPLVRVHERILGEQVMVDFYSSSCGACKYLLPQVVRLCKKGCEDNCSVDERRGLVFLKHNVRDEYDELTNGSPIENLVTRDKQRLEDTLCQILGQLLD